MTISENSPLPGWPYLLAALIVYLSYYYSQFLPDSDDEEFVHELERKKQRQTTPPRYLRIFSLSRPPTRESFPEEEDIDEEYENLLESDEQMAMLSEIEESDEEGFATESDAPTTPISFASLMGKPLEPIGKTPQ
jgi:hypothetical protein